VLSTGGIDARDTYYDALTSSSTSCLSRSLKASTILLWERGLNISVQHAHRGGAPRAAAAAHELEPNVDLRRCIHIRNRGDNLERDEDVQ
jgi:hypothetical protein